MAQCKVQKQCWHPGGVGKIKLETREDFLGGSLAVLRGYRTCALSPEMVTVVASGHPNLLQPERP